MISDGPVPLASRSQKSLGDAQYSGPSPTSAPVTKQQLAASEAPPASSPSWYPRRQANRGQMCHCRYKALLGRCLDPGGTGRSSAPGIFRACVNALEASEFRPPHQVITPSPRGHLTGVAGSRRSQDEALPGRRVPPQLSTAGLTETRGPGPLPASTLRGARVV